MHTSHIRLEGEETRSLVEAMLDLVQCARRVESAKMDLACCRDFNLIEAFQIFDVNGAGVCSKNMLYNTFMDFKPNFPIDYKLIQKFFFRYNKSRDGNLKYSEFMHAICPLDEKYAAMMKDKRVVTKVNHLPFHCKLDLREVE